MTLAIDTTMEQKRHIRDAKLAEFARFARRFRRNRLGMTGFTIILLLLLSAIFAPLLATHDPYLPELAKRLSPPGGEYWLGADELGRDIYTRILYGSRLTLLIVLQVVVTAAPLGLIVGAVAGTFGGIIDKIFMRITDVFLAVPKLLLALAFVAALGPGIVNAVLAISLCAWPP